MSTFDDCEISEPKQDRVVSNDFSFLIVPRPLMEIYGPQLGACGLAVYCAVRYYENYCSHSAFVLTSTIAKLLGMGESTVRRELTKLHNLGIITKNQRKSKSSVYVVEDFRSLIAGVPLSNSSSSAIRELHNKTVLNQMVSNNPDEAKASESGGLFPLEAEDQKPIEDITLRIWAYYQKKLAKPFSTFTPKRRTMAKKRFADALKMTKGDAKKAEEFMEIAVEELALSDFHNATGKYKGGTKYNDFEYAFGSEEKFSKWLNKSNE